MIDVAERKVRSRYALPNGVITFPHHTSPPDKFRWSPDGRNILISWESALVIAVETGRNEAISSTPVVSEWAPGGDAVYYFEVTNAHTAEPREFGGFYVKRLGEAAIELMDQATLETAGFKIKGPMYGLMTLAPSGNKVAISSGSTEGNGDIIRVYDFQAAPLSLASPLQKVELKESTAALDWAPDEQSLAVVTVLGSDIKVNLLDLVSGERKVLAKWQLLDGMEIEIFTLKALSWTQ
jgi:hypothetical protein